MPGILAFGKPMWEGCLKLTAAWHSEFWASMRYNETLPLPKKEKEKKGGIEVAQPLKVFVPKLDITWCRGRTNFPELFSDLSSYMTTCMHTNKC